MLNENGVDSFIQASFLRPTLLGPALRCYEWAFPLTRHLNQTESLPNVKVSANSTELFITRNRSSSQIIMRTGDGQQVGEACLQVATQNCCT